MQVQGVITQAVSVDEFKRSIHVRPEDVEDDTLFEALLAGAQIVVETGTNRPLTSRTVIIDCRAGVGLRWWLPCAPVASIGAIEWQDAGTWTALDHSGAWLEQGYDEPQLVLPQGFWDGVSDGAAVRVTATVGYDVAQDPLKQAIILVASEWYEAGIDPDRDGFPKPSFGCRALMRQGRYSRPCEWALA